MSTHPLKDFLPTAYPPLYQNKLLLTPSKPSSHPIVQAYVSENDTSNVLVVEREQVTMSGGECDKIGTAYRAFQT